MYSPLFFFGGDGMLERDFQAFLIREIKAILPGCLVLKNDPTYKQGIPDLIILYENKWAALECKKDRYAKSRPNQKHYINLMDDMSFAAFIYPENEQKILNELEDFMKN